MLHRMKQKDPPPCDLIQVCQRRMLQVRQSVRSPSLRLLQSAVYTRNVVGNEGCVNPRT